ncbi:MAG: ABC transporter substrate-binding protein [Burkholderiales bacterium]|nr:ABC transporter substrate-binding protein [Burkholderiales bacterium]
MNRRNTLTGLAALALAPRLARAQRMPVIGFLHPGFPGIAGTNPAAAALVKTLRQNGFIDGETIKIEYRWGQGKPEAMAGLAADLVRLKPDAIAALGTSSIVATKAATSQVPIIGVDLEADPVAAGYVASLARPGGNITGLFLDQSGMAGKWLQLIREAVPGVQRVAVLWDVNTGPYQKNAMVAAAKTLSVDARLLEFRDLAGLESVLSTGLNDRPHAIVQLGSPMFSQFGSRIAGFLAPHRLPGISPHREYTTNGGLMSYGPNRTLFFERLGHYVTRIIKGTPVSQLPVELPTRFEFLLNAKAAKALGIKFPMSILTQADEVIE